MSILVMTFSSDDFFNDDFLLMTSFSDDFLVMTFIVVMFWWWLFFSFWSVKEKKWDVTRGRKYTRTYTYEHNMDRHTFIQLHYPRTHRRLHPSTPIHTHVHIRPSTYTHKQHAYTLIHTLTLNGILQISK